MQKTDQEVVDMQEKLKVIWAFRIYMPLEVNLFDAFKNPINKSRLPNKVAFFVQLDKKQKKQKCLVRQQVSPCYDRGSTAKPGGGQM